MIPIPPQVAFWAMRGGILVAVAASIWLHGCHTGESRQAHKTALVKAEYKGFVDETKRLGKDARDKAEREKAADKLNKERTDEESARSLTALRADRDRLRKSAGPVGRIVPAAAAAADRPDRITFDRAELDREIREALENFRTATRGIVDEGAEARLKLDAAIRWAAPRN